MVDSNNVEIRYSLRPMTQLRRHICLAKVGASLQQAIRQKPIVSFLRAYFPVRRRGRTVYY